MDVFQLVEKKSTGELAHVANHVLVSPNLGKELLADLTVVASHSDGIALDLGRTIRQTPGIYVILVV